MTGFIKAGEGTLKGLEKRIEVIHEPKRIEKKFCCPIHGDVTEFVSENEPLNHCPKCAAEKREKEQEKINLLESDRIRAKGLRNFLGNEPFSPYDPAQTFENYVLTGSKEQKRALAIAKRFSENLLARKLEGKEKSKIGLLFHGVYGAGKTHLASAIVTTAKAQGFCPTFWTLRGLMALFKPGSNLPHQTLLSYLTSITLLVIDEVGRGAGSDFENNILIELIDARAHKGNPTVLITNLGGEEYRDMLGGAVSSRTQSLFYRVPFSWGDYRKKINISAQDFEEVF